LEPYFQKWEGVWKQRRRDLNNPKVPVKFVRQEGILVYPARAQDDAQRDPGG
jgi:type II restriction enzyme